MTRPYCFMCPIRGASYSLQAGGELPQHHQQQHVLLGTARPLCKDRVPQQGGDGWRPEEGPQGALHLVRIRHPEAGTPVHSQVIPARGGADLAEHLQRGDCAAPLSQGRTLPLCLSHTLTLSLFSLALSLSHSHTHALSHKLLLMRGDSNHRDLDLNPSSCTASVICTPSSGSVWTSFLLRDPQSSVILMASFNPNGHVNPSCKGCLTCTASVFHCRRFNSSEQLRS